MHAYAVPAAAAYPPTLGPARACLSLQSLDVARGVTIALMIFVDNVGDSW